MLGRIFTSRWMQFVLLFSILFVCAIAATNDNRVTETLRNYAFDQFNRWDERVATNQVIIVDIDENSLKEIGQWPWPRDVIAEIVLNLKDMGAKAIAFDVSFTDSDRLSPKQFADTLFKKQVIDLSVYESLMLLPDNDETLAKAIQKAGNVVTGFTHAPSEDTKSLPKLKKRLLIKRDQVLLFYENIFYSDGALINKKIISDASAGNGSFLTFPDDDGIIRKYNAIVGYGNEDINYEIYSALGLEALRVSHSKKEHIKIKKFRPSKDAVTWSEKLRGLTNNQYEMVIGQNGRVVPITYYGHMPLKFRKLNKQTDYLSVSKVLAEKNNYKDQVKDKIVLIGTSAPALGDIRNTPLEPFVPGVELHFNFIEQVLQNTFLFRDGLVSTQTELLAILSCGLIIVLISLYFGVITLIISTSLFIFLICFGCFYLYTDHNLLFDPINTSLSIFVIFVLATLLNYLRSEMTRREIKSAFGLYISPEFMTELTDNPDKLTLGGEMRDLTVMFTDIRNFTTISESMSPEALINTMNDFLTPMSDVVMETRGTIDKYMGDAMMAFWNAPLDDADHAKHAVDAALAMKASLEPVNEALRVQAEKDGVEPLQLAAGIGVNTGPCAVGNMGSKQRFAYSALGDAVNLASRLEGQTKSYGLDLLVGLETVNKLPNYAVMDIDMIQVKGKTEPAQIYTVLGNEDVSKTSDFQAFIADHDVFLKCYRAGDFKQAETGLQKAKAHDIAAPYHAYYAMMEGRISEYKKTPPSNWNGVFVATSK